MGAYSKENREFLMMQVEDKGYGTNQEPSGYLKIEVREKRGKLTLFAQNIKEVKEFLCYRLYLLRSVNSEFQYVCAGEIPQKNNTASLEWTFDAREVESTGSPIEKFNVLAILVEEKNKKPGEIICPLSSYRDGQVEWRKKLKEALFQKEVRVLNNSQMNIAQISDDPPILYESSTVLGGEDVENGEKDLLCKTNMLKNILDKNFEVCNPFHIARNDYIWWNVPSPVQLNNILYQCDIRTPLLFNPKVISAHFKFKHLLIGMYTNGENGEEYLVCGIPGEYRIEENPFGEWCRFAQTGHNGLEQGTAGYWLVYMDYKNGRFLRLQ